MNTQNTPFNHTIFVTNRQMPVRPFLSQIDRICQLQPRVVVLREKDLPEEEYISLAKSVLAVCARRNVPCILHSVLPALEACDQIIPAGIHLPLYRLRELAEKGIHIPDNFLTGCSVHSPEEAVEAERLGAAYLFAGHVYATDCKKGLPPRGLGFLKKVCESVSIPVYAIGGMRIEGEFPECRPDPVQKREISECGAAGMAVMSGCMRV